MIRDICRDEAFLAQQAEPAGPEDLAIAADLLETDAPYLAPVPMRGRRNEPAYVAYTAACIAQLRGMAPQDLAQAAYDNGRRFFRIGQQA